jgi:hypothetical protein
MTSPLAELFAVPDRITVTPFYNGFNIRCELCSPYRTKSINWHPDKRPAPDRASDYVVGHLRSTHKLKITTEVALEFVNRAASEKTPAKSEQIETPRFPFSPFESRRL